jgi:hypothetical protein
VCLQSRDEKTNCDVELNFCLAVQKPASDHTFVFFLLLLHLLPLDESEGTTKKRLSGDEDVCLLHPLVVEEVKVDVMSVDLRSRVT